MNALIMSASSPFTSNSISKFPSSPLVLRNGVFRAQFWGKSSRFRASSNGLDRKAVEEGLGDSAETKVEDEQEIKGANSISNGAASTTINPALDKELKKVVQKTAATFAPRASTASKNPAVPGTTLYTVFEVQGYISMLLGGALSFNLIFPSNEPDIWRLMGMWSIWMFTIPSLRARDCSKNEKEALNYLFLLIPLLNIIVPFFWKSFAVVWSVDIVAFFGMYAWKVGWVQKQ
nr:protein RESISTANCE TO PHYTOPHTHORA 1, chloroplastic-like [Ipomoea batatas]